jgi:light-regulated signal transduction histidine kinase (bacteriophytochrome)
MQTLLIDLVNYSRTIKGDKVFVKTDLNKVIEEILQDLSSNIEDKKAIITIGNLPTIKAIPFQVKQLFINLISNSLKYSKEDVAPEISITSKKITEKEMHDYKIANKKDYHKIVISDNGIGFKQEYSGTGLGLAICSRIVDNHKGFIKVKAKPGLGAKFYIFIPKGDLL